MSLNLDEQPDVRLPLNTLVAVRSQNVKTYEIFAYCSELIPFFSRASHVVRIRSAEQFTADIAEATDAFWEVIAAKFPEVASGDFSPAQVDTFNEFAITAVITWLNNNYPNNQKQ
jgi:hypothetical protein